jgi:Arc/MetJ family transcription regulator
VDRLLTLKIDSELLMEARQQLGTSNGDETVERALKEVINLGRRRRLAEAVLPGLTPESLEEIRRNRTS